MQNLRETIWQAENGKIFKNKETGVIGCEYILLAKSDSISNYEEIDKPMENADTSTKA